MKIEWGLGSEDEEEEGQNRMNKNPLTIIFV